MQKLLIGFVYGVLSALLYVQHVHIQHLRMAPVEAEKARIADLEAQIEEHIQRRKAIERELDWGGTGAPPLFDGKM